MITPIEKKSSLYLAFSNYEPKPTSLARFRKWHVEPLLNQAADLMDRCVNEREQHRLLMAKWDLLQLEREEEERQLKLIEQRISRDMFSLEINKLTNEHTSKISASEKMDKAIKEYVDWNYPITNPQAHYGYAIIHEAELRKQHFIKDAELIKMQLDWEINEKAFKEQAFQDAKAIREAKNRLLTDGSFNYKTQAEAMIPRISSDFEDAYDRMSVAYEGLIEFYAYNKDENSFPFPKKLTSGNDQIDSAVLWVRSAIRWLIAFGQLDQGWIKVFSLRSILGDEEWKKIQANKKNVVFSFPLPIKHFNSHHFVRLRGISMFVKTNNLNQTPWSATISLPKTAISRQIWGNRTELANIEQGDLPTCYLGRIEKRNSARQPEVAGLVSVTNASPISANSQSGLWTIQINAPESTGDLTVLEDLELELNLVGHPQ